MKVIYLLMTVGIWPRGIAGDSDRSVAGIVTNEGGKVEGLFYIRCYKRPVTNRAADFGSSHFSFLALKKRQ